MYRCQEMPVFVCNAVLADELWDPLDDIEEYLEILEEQPLGLGNIY